jgi:uncharacterized protein
MIVDEWCYGYIRGVVLRAEAWQALPEETNIQLGRISLFGSDDGNAVLETLSPEDIATIKGGINNSARLLFTYWLENRVDDVDAVMPFVREGAKVGRNDPCSCGSGKKYKKCCGAN